ncbi:MAG: hypothetical protein Fur0036_19570 [Fimbriimonadaceae bacterium]
MERLRYGYVLVMALLLGLGYAASQYHFFNGTAAQYAAQVDVPTIRSLALLLLVAGIALGFAKSPSSDPESTPVDEESSSA